MMGFVITDEERVFCCVVRGLINLHQGRVFLFCDDGLRPFLLWKPSFLVAVYHDSPLGLESLLWGT